MKYIIEARNIWELGQRTSQEDSIFPQLGELTDTDRLFVVCDGMGGHDAGEVASQTVCQALAEAVKKVTPDAEGDFSEEDFMQALKDAYDELDSKDTGAEKKMGTTMTLFKLHSNGCFIAHIGDSRVYHIRPGKDEENTEILFQTRDHSLVNDLIKIGELTPEEAKYSKQKNVITRAMQPNMERRPRADIYESSDIKAGDYFLLCTDGILEQMEDENIKFIFSERNGDIDRKKDMLIDVTTDNRDNHSAIVVHIIEVISDKPEKKEECECQELPVKIGKKTVDVKKKDIEAVGEMKSSSSRKPSRRNLFYLLIIFAFLAAVVYVLGGGDLIKSIINPVKK